MSPDALEVLKLMNSKQANRLATFRIGSFPRRCAHNQASGHLAHRHDLFGMRAKRETAPKQSCNMSSDALMVLERMSAKKAARTKPIGKRERRVTHDGVRKMPSVTKSAGKVMAPFPRELNAIQDWLPLIPPQAKGSGSQGCIYVIGSESYERNVWKIAKTSGNPDQRAGWHR